MWRMGLPTVALLEDMRGALAEDQLGLVRHNARAIGQNCAVVLNLMRRHDRPIPVPRMRASWALDRLGEEEFANDCWELIRGDLALSAEDLLTRSERLVHRVRDLVGELPDPLTPEGYYPALALARDWLKFTEMLGEGGFLPKEWTAGASTNDAPNA